MRVAFVTNTCLPFYQGGYEKRTWDFARALARRGHHVTIYTSCALEEWIEGVRFVRLARKREFFNPRGVRNGWADVYFTLSVLKLLLRDEFWVEGKRPDVMDVCATPFLHLFTAGFVARFFGIPWVATCHEALLGSMDAYTEERRSWAWTRRGLASLLRAIYWSAQQLPDALVAVSESTYRGLIAEGFSRVEWVANGLEAPAPKETPVTKLARAVRLIFVGRLTPNKNVDVAIAALNRLVKTHPEIALHLTIVGEGGERTALMDQVIRLGLAGVVKFTGSISETDKWRELRACDIFIMPSCREGFSYATAEAMAAGCAIVAASPPPPRPASAVTDYLRHNENALIYDGAAGSLAVALERCLRDPQFLTQLRDAAHETAKEFTLDRKIDETERLHAAMAGVVIPGKRS